MYGAIIGDLAGSIYEYNQLKNVTSIKMNNIIEDNSFYSDDTIYVKENLIVKNT